MRALALCRVLAWHAYGAVAISWVIAAVPTMFFVSGRLFASSAAARPARQVVTERLRRIVVPWYVLTAAVWAVGVVHPAGNGDATSSWRWIGWVIPIVDPPPLAWERGWVSTPLWYIRVVVWVLVAAPVLLWLVRRWPRLTPLAGVAAVFAIDRGAAMAGSVGVSSGWWFAGQFVLYLTFFAVGASARIAPPRLPAWAWPCAAAVAAGAAVGWVVTHDVPEGVVNNSHPLHLIVGAGWLAVLVAARRPIRRVAALGAVRRVVAPLARRSLTIYLWHPVVIFGLLVVDERWGFPANVAGEAAFLVLGIAGVAAAATLLGPVEDLAAGRAIRRRRIPLHLGTLRLRPILSGIGVACVVASLSFVLVTPPPARGEQRTWSRLPSMGPPAPSFQTQTPSTVAPVRTDPGLILDRWTAAHPTVQGILVGLRNGATGQTWTTARGSGLDGTPADPHQRFEVQSGTKLLTAYLAHLAVDRSLLTLDGPIAAEPPISELPNAGDLTLRLLLGHRSGLVNYRDTPTYHADPSLIEGPLDAIRAAAVEPARFSPGASAEYSSTNYLVVGRLLELATGDSFEELLQREVLTPLGLQRTIHRGSLPGSPNQGTAGIETDLLDWLAVGQSVIRDGAGLSPSARAAMHAIDPDTGIGLGVMGYCPCSRDAAGKPTYALSGHTGGQSMVVYAPATDLLIVVELVDGLYTDEGMARVDAVVDLLNQLATNGVVPTR